MLDESEWDYYGDCYISFLLNKIWHAPEDNVDLFETVLNFAINQNHEILPLWTNIYA